MAAQVVEGGQQAHHPPSSPPPPATPTHPSALDRVQKTKTLICALNLLSRNLPLPADVFTSVSSIYNGGDGGETGAIDESVDNVGNPDSSASARGTEDTQLADQALESASGANKDSAGASSYRDLIMEFEDSLVRQRPSCMSATGLTELKESRFQSQMDHRLKELEGCSTLASNLGFIHDS